MNEQLNRLIELQQIDAKILAKRRLIEAIPLRISTVESLLNNSLAAFDKAKQKHDSLEKKKRTRERALEDFNEKIKKLKARTAEIKTNKEYQALLKEIESVEKELSEAEDEILIIMEEIDASSKEIRLEEERLKNEKEKIASEKKKLDEEMQECEKELLPLKETRAGIVDAVDEELYKQYIELFESYNGMAVTEAKEEICQGCNMNIPPQLFVELKKAEDIIICPQCRRILYYRNNT